MASTLTLRVITPESTILDREVRSVRFEGLDGAYGILANHAALMTAMKPGLLRFETSEGETEQLLVTDGFAEMRDNVLSIISEAGEQVGKIDVERARRAETKAREMLRDRASLESAEVIAAESALRRALARQLAAGGRREGRADI